MSQNEIENCKARDGKAEVMSDAVTALKRGEVIVYPTETLYGIGADALNAAAVERVFQLKGRDPGNPMPLLVADREMLGALVAGVPPLAAKLMARFWPGPLTLVLPARPHIARPLVNASGGVAVRISSQSIATALVKALGRPLTATSANPSGEAPARTIHDAKNYFAAQFAIYVDGGELTSKHGSTVVEVSGGGLKILREGEISRSQLQIVIEEGGLG